MAEEDIFTLDYEMFGSDQSYFVMLVDDQQIVAEGLRRIVEPEPDINYHYCNNPLQAIKTAEEIRPSLILLDLLMPEVDGLTLLRYMRSNTATKNIPIIVLSSREEPEGKAEAFNAGANDYLIKWPDKIELLARIRYHARWYIMLKQRDQAYKALQVSQSKLEQTNLKLQEIASRDGLTGIPNRRSFTERLEIEWNRSIRESIPLSLVMIDIDHFKKYNDLYGHLQGDECLKRVASTIAETLARSTDMAARYGGEEFGAILPNTDKPGLVKVAERIRSAIESLLIPHENSDTDEIVTISLGGATATPTKGDKMVTLIECADDHLYRAKESGRNRFVV